MTTCKQVSQGSTQLENVLNIEERYGLVAPLYEQGKVFAKHLRGADAL